MKNFLLLLLTLITGLEAEPQKFEVKACVGGWVDFICRYPDVNQTYRAVDVEFEGRSLNFNVEKQWKHVEGVSVILNTASKNLRVIIRHLRPNDFGEFECKFFLNPEGEKEVEVNIKEDINVCPSPSNQTAYLGARTTIMCEFPKNLKKTWVKFLCKDNNVTCEDILTTESPRPSNGTFGFIKTRNGFNVSISNVSKEHEGVYWCGLKPADGRYRAGFKQLRLKVKDVLTVRLSPSVGQTVTFRCNFSNDPPVKRFLCKGEDPDTCKLIVSTSKTVKGRFSLRQDLRRSYINVTVRDIRAEDAGTYWCAADPQHPGIFISQRLLMTVVSPGESLPSETTPTSPDVSLLSIIIPVVISAVVLLIFVILDYKRFKCLKNGKKVQMKTDKEERAYEEIQERPPETNSGTVLNTIYTTAQHPTVPSAPALHSNITVRSSGDVNDHTYSTAWDATQSPTYSTVNPPTTSSDDPFYSTLSNPQQP